MSNSSFSPLWATKSEKKKHKLVSVRLPHNRNTIVSASGENGTYKNKWYTVHLISFLYQPGVYVSISKKKSYNKVGQRLLSHSPHSQRLFIFLLFYLRLHQALAKTGFWEKVQRTASYFAEVVSFKQNRTASGNDILLKYCIFKNFFFSFLFNYISIWSKPGANITNNQWWPKLGGGCLWY